MEKENPFPIGPVTIFSREHWIDAVDFPPNAIAKFINLPEENARWKESLKQALNNPDEGKSLRGLACTVFPAVRSCSAVLKVTVKGYERSLQAVVDGDQRDRVHIEK
jgi:hypothetical protein